MKKHFSDYLVALVVIACSLVLLAALAAALSGRKGSRNGRTLEIDYPDVTGIRLHSEVRYAGAPAGSVKAMRLLTFEERQAATEERQKNAVRVTVELGAFVPPLTTDVQASLGSDTLLSDKFVALSAGSPDAPALALGLVLQGRSSGGLEKLADSIGPLAQSLGPMMERLDTILRDIGPLLQKTGSAVDTFKDGIGDALPRVSKLADGLKSTSDAAEMALKRIDKLVSEVDEPVKSDLREIKGALVQLDQALGSAERFLSHTDKSLSGRLQELAIVLQNLKVVSTHAKAVTQALGEKPNRLIFSGKPQKLTSEQEILRSDKPLPAVQQSATGGTPAEVGNRQTPSGGAR